MKGLVKTSAINIDINAHEINLLRLAISRFTGNMFALSGYLNECIQQRESMLLH